MKKRQGDKCRCSFVGKDDSVSSQIPAYDGYDDECHRGYHRYDIYDYFKKWEKGEEKVIYGKN